MMIQLLIVDDQTAIYIDKNSVVQLKLMIMWHIKKMMKFLLMNVHF